MSATVTTNLDIGVLNQITDLAFAEPGAIDQVFDEEPIAAELLKNQRNASGPGIRQLITVERGSTFQYNSGGKFQFTQKDPTQLLQFKWVNGAAEMMIPITSADFAESKEAYGNLIKIQRDSAMSSLLHDVAQQFRGFPVANWPTTMQSFATICAATGNYGGLSRTTYPILNGSNLSCSTLYGSAPTTSNLVTNNLLVTYIQLLVDGASGGGKKETTTVVFLPPLMWRVLNTIGNQILSPAKAADSRIWGGTAWDINGILCVQDKEMAEGTIFACNFNYLDVFSHPKYAFTFTGWKEDLYSDNMIGLLKLSGEIASLKPKRQGTLTACPTAWA